MGKETVLALLLREKGHFVSGEAVSAELGITRAAIWKSISALRAQGYEIDAVTGRGYCLKSLPDTLTEQTVRSYLGPVETVGKRIDCFDSIDSTNAYLKRIALDGAPDGTVAVAAEQTSGRGRRGRSFQSAAGKGVYLSILLRPKLAPSQLMPLTGLIAVAMSRAVDRVAGTHSQIKWTNDLVYDRRKLCGILTELEWEAESGEFSCVIIGAGINVSQDEADFGPEVAPIAISLAQALGTAPDRTELAAQVIRSLNALYDDFPAQNAAYLDHFRRDCLTVGNPIKVISGAGERIGTATGISDDFGLTVRWEDGSTETLTSGEVSVRGLYDYV